MTLFTGYPVVVYPLVDEDGNKSHYTLTDITTRVSINMSAHDIELMTQPYEIQNGETPDLVSYKVYGTPDYHWAVMHVNNIIDYLDDWCKSETQLKKWCENKYGAAMNDPMYLADSSGNFVRNPDAQVYADDSGNLAIYTNTTGLHTVSFYEYESLVNEQRRNIRVVRPDKIRTYVELFNAELTKIVK